MSDQIQSVLKESRIFPPPAEFRAVAFGHRVAFKRDDGRRQAFRIVGEDEADLVIPPGARVVECVEDRSRLGDLRVAQQRPGPQLLHETSVAKRRLFITRGGSWY